MRRRWQPCCWAAVPLPRLATGAAQAAHRPHQHQCVYKQLRSASANLACRSGQRAHTHSPPSRRTRSSVCRYWGDAASPLAAGDLANNSFFTGGRFPVHRILVRLGRSAEAEVSPIEHCTARASRCCSGAARRPARVGMAGCTRRPRRLLACKPHSLRLPVALPECCPRPRLCWSTA